MLMGRPGSDLEALSEIADVRQTTDFSGTNREKWDAEVCEAPL